MTSVAPAQTWRLTMGDREQLYVVLSLDDHKAHLFCLDDGWLGYEHLQWMNGIRRSVGMEWERFA